MELPSPEKIEQFKKTITALKQDVAILAGIADPDSLANAQLMSKVLIHFDKTPHIFFLNDKDDPNIAIWINSFELTVEPSTMSVFLEDPKKYSVILLDLNDVRILGLEPEQIVINIVIDHHEKVIDEKKVSWSWIDKSGASTSMTMYLFEQLQIADISNDENLATQCAVAIIVDLGGNVLSSECTLLDLQMLTKTKPSVNTEKAGQLAYIYYNKKLFHLMGEAWKNHSEKGQVVVTHLDLGSIKENEHVYLAVIADLLYKFTCFDIVIVWAKTNDTKRILYKARSGKKEMSLDHVIKNEFGESGGARAGKGAGFLPALPKVFNPLDQDAEYAFIQFMQLQMFAIASQYASE